MYSSIAIYTPNPARFHSPTGTRYCNLLELFTGLEYTSCVRLQLQYACTGQSALTRVMLQYCCMARGLSHTRQPRGPAGQARGCTKARGLSTSHGLRPRHALPAQCQWWTQAGCRCAGGGWRMVGGGHRPHLRGPSSRLPLVGQIGSSASVMQGCCFRVRACLFFVIPALSGSRASGTCSSPF